ncbi:mechanosensitive ion channel family protein [Segatella baroniae]|uniref:mechanosensitive ion channel family protein n=1 Tax=Segatella baroniae TaxID=305719 RepID=UPI00040B8B41|nr:mechanosensitive ion channel domain-containing protein [Segatella baroniae]
MGKRTLVWLLLATYAVLPSKAVLKERDLSKTLSILRQELTRQHDEQERQSDYLKEQQQQVQQNMYRIMNQSNQNSLMLYSQKQGYVFDLSYACHEATEQYHEFKETVKPFNAFITKTNNEIARFDSLIINLSNMPLMSLSPREQTDRTVCLALAVNIRRNLNENSMQFKEFIRYYKLTEDHLRNLDDYANKRYKEIQNNIFNNGSDNYFSILRNLHRNLLETSETVVEKYRVDRKVQSDWDARVLLGLLLLIVGWGVFSVFLNFIFIRLLMTRILRNPKANQFFSKLMKKKDEHTLAESFMAKRTCIFLATSVITFAIVLGIIRVIWIDQNFIIMASQLLVEYAWLMGVISISLLVRLDGDQIKSGYRIYVPLLVVGFIVIAFRIVLIPNDLVELVFPPILLACTIWQWIAIRHNNHNIPKSDVFYTYLSLTVFFTSLVCSWIGYVLLSVQLLIWWIMQLTCILTITCIQGLLQNRGRRKQYFAKEKTIAETWLFRLVYQVALPILGIISIIVSIYWAADVFNLSDTTWRIFTEKVIDSPNFTLSIFGISQVMVLYFIFKYLNRTAIEWLEYHFKRVDPTTYISRTAMSKNVIQVIVWGIWLLTTLSIFHVNNSWFVVVSGGLSTGVGFAMKDILENIYYGISLMAGRIKIGDWIECDGIRGRVSSISYTSTQLDAVDGSIIAFQNSQLFTKNYKNLTKNHGYGLSVIPIGVAYGSDANEVKAILVKAISALDCLDKKREVKVVFAGFGSDSIDFKVVAWVPVLKQTYAEGEIMETIYRVLNENHIEIPFPQRDIHIIRADDENELRTTLK